VTPPNAAVLKLRKSRVSRRAAIAHAGMFIGMGKSMSCAEGF
jgi:hypothetical protein